MLTKNQIIILIVVVVLIFGGIIGWTIFQEEKLPPEEEVIPEEIIPEEVFSLSGIVSSIDAENNFLMVIPTGQEKEIKVNLNENIEFMEMETESFFTADSREIEGSRKIIIDSQKETKPTIRDLKIGDLVSVHSVENISGKTEINNVDFLQFWHEPFNF